MIPGRLDRVVKLSTGFNECIICSSDCSASYRCSFARAQILVILLIVLLQPCARSMALHQHSGQYAHETRNRCRLGPLASNADEGKELTRHSVCCYQLDCHPSPVAGLQGVRADRRQLSSCVPSHAAALPPDPADEDPDADHPVQDIIFAS